MLVVLCALLGAAEGFVEITRWGELNLEFLRRFVPYKRGIRSHNALNDLFNTLDHDAFRDSFVAWAASLRAAGESRAEPALVAVGGKTSCRTGDARTGNAASEVRGHHAQYLPHYCPVNRRIDSIGYATPSRAVCIRCP